PGPPAPRRRRESWDPTDRRQPRPGAVAAMRERVVATPGAHVDGLDGGRDLIGDRGRQVDGHGAPGGAGQVVTEALGDLRADFETAGADVRADVGAVDVAHPGDGPGHDSGRNAS